MLKGTKLTSSRRQRFLIIPVLVFAAAGAFQVRAQEPLTDVRPPKDVSKAGTQSALAAANQLYRDGNFESAAEAYKAITGPDDQAALAAAGLARVYLALKRPNEAAEAALKAAKLAPALDAVHVALGEVYFRQGKMADAEKEFTPLVKADTKEARAYLGLARLYHAASFYQHARSMIDHAHSLDPDDPDIQRQWIRTLSNAERLRRLEERRAAARPNEDPERRSGDSGPSKSFHPCGLVNKIGRAS